MRDSMGGTPIVLRPRIGGSAPFPPADLTASGNGSNVNTYMSVIVPGLVRAV
ncbi:MAG: hypothetical protein AMXMBFR83_30960 [Phycisphaerae bacterium]